MTTSTVTTARVAPPQIKAAASGRASAALEVVGRAFERRVVAVGPRLVGAVRRSTSSWRSATRGCGAGRLRGAPDVPPRWPAGGRCRAIGPPRAPSRAVVATRGSRLSCEMFDHLVRRHGHEGPPRLREMADHLPDLVGGGLGDGGDLVERGGPADLAAVGPELGEPLEHQLGDPAAAVVRQLVIGLVGMAGQGLGKSSGGLVVLEIDGARCSPVLGPEVPGSHQRVLEHRQDVGIGAGVVEQSLDEPGGDRATSDRGRRGDGFAELGTGEPGDEEEAPVDGLGEVAELRAVAQEVRPHRQDHVDAASSARVASIRSWTNAEASPAPDQDPRR